MCKRLLVFSLAFCLALLFSQIIEQFKTTFAENQKTVALKAVDSTQVDSNSLHFSNFVNTSNVQQAIKDNGRFGVAGVEQDKEVKDLYLKFQRAVVEDDRKTVASLINYPLNVNFPTDKPNRNYTLIKNKKIFLDVYDRIFHKKLIEFIARIDVEKEDEEDIWARYDGIAVGRGVIWIGVYCYKRDCSDNKYHINIRTIHSGSNLMDLD